MHNTSLLSENELARISREVQLLSIRIGKFIADERTKIQISDIEEKSFNNLVSYVDKTAEELFVKELSLIFPEAGFIAEENSTLERKQAYNWVIDPLDGTTNYLHGIPCYATSVALVHLENPLLGVIYEINQKECFYAWENGGAWMNGKPIQVSNCTVLKKAVVGTGFPYYTYDLQQSYLNLFGDLQKETRSMRRIGSAATDIAYVACGRFDAFFEYGLHAWDVAAGIILLQEAGGISSDFEGKKNELFGKRFVCGNPQIHAQLLEKIQTHFKS
jgi:myo-inositol-1(or 4)-monophosphatase